MKVTNTELVQIMMATEGMDFYDKQNTEKAEMLGTNGDQYYRRCSSRASLVFLDAFCTELRLGNEPVIFRRRRTSKPSDSLFWEKANILRRLHCGGFSVKWNFISLDLTHSRIANCALSCRKPSIL